MARATLSQFVGSDRLTALSFPPQHCCSNRRDKRQRRPISTPIRLRWNKTRRSIRRVPSSGRLNVPTFRNSLCKLPRTRAAPAPRPMAYRLGGLNGLAPTVQDYALGFTVTFPILDLAGASRSGSRAIGHHPGPNGAIRANCDRPAGALEPGARGSLTARKDVAANTPVQVSAARAAAQQATARYQVGSRRPSIQVAEAQRLLTQAEIDDALARLDVWRASARHCDGCRRSSALSREARPVKTMKATCASS